MIVATTPKPWVGLINIIQRNAIRSWLRQTEPSEIILYGDDRGTKEVCEEFGLTHVPDIEFTSYGTPNIGWIFRDLQKRGDIVTYINADIVLSNDHAFSAIGRVKYPKFTATAARAGMIITEEIQHWDYFYSAVSQFLLEQKPRCGVDIFIFTDLSPMPDFALGRGFWDKWFVATCTKQGLPFINLTPKFWTIHQSHDYNHLNISNKHAWDTRGFNWENGEGKGPETRINKALYLAQGLPPALNQPYIRNCRAKEPKTYHMVDRKRAGTDHHRSGWPAVCNELAKDANGTVLLDDFVSQSFEWGSEKQCHTKPWVGVFHHPVRIFSPLEIDRKRELTKLSGVGWELSRKNLIGAIALSTDVATALGRWLKVPVEVIKHPTTPALGRWSLNNLRANRLRIIQIGEAHRDIRFIHRFNAPESPWTLHRLLRNSKSQQIRDELLKELHSDANSVTELPRQDNREYDNILNSSVVIQYAYGTAANNLVTECIAHGTPLITNRTPSLEEYLGRDYPLFFDEEVPKHFWHASVLEKASAHLLKIKLPTTADFAQQVDNFISSL